MRHLTFLTVLVFTGLTGCFNGSSDQAATTPPPAQPDSFVVEVQRQVSIPEATAEPLEAIQVANIVETAPETDEPIALVF